MNAFSFFSFTPELISKINTEFSELFFFQPLKNIMTKILVREKIKFLENACQLSHVLKIISQFDFTECTLKERRLLRKIEYRNFLKDLLVDEFLENNFPLIVGQYYDIFPGITDHIPFKKFYCQRKLFPTVYEVSALLEDNSLNIFRLILSVNMAIIESDEQCFAPPNVYFLKRNFR